MKKYIVLSLFIPYLLLYPGVIEKTFLFKESEISFQKQKGYDYITLKGCFYPRNLGLPLLPCKSARFVIPPSAIVTDVKVISSSSKVLPGSYYVYPAQRPVPISFPVKDEFIPPDEKIYASESLYPGNLIKTLPTGNKAGFRIVQVNLFPIQYQPKQRKLIFYNSITIRIEFKEGVYPVNKLSERQIQVFGREIKEMVENPEDVDRYAPGFSGYGLLITPHPIEGVKIAGKAKIAPIPAAKSEIRILEAQKRKIHQTEDNIKKTERERIEDVSSQFVIHKPWLEAPHPVTKRLPQNKGTIVNAHISSPHPYFNSMDQSYYVYGPPENNWMHVHFDTIDVESGYDTVYVYDNDGTLLNTYSGAYGPTWSDWGDGPTFRIRIKSDGSVKKYGFVIDYIQVGGECSYENSQHPYANNTDESVDMYGPANDWLGELCFHYDSIRTESGYDSVYCYDMDNSTILNTWTGEYDNVWSGWSSYNSEFTIQPHERTRLVSDLSVTDWGWTVGYYNLFREHHIESPHNYPNNANQTYYVYGPQDQGSIQMRIHFVKLYTESNYDTVYVYDGKGNLMNIYTGDCGTDFWTNWGDSSFVRIVLKSDGSVNKWGFKCDQYEWRTSGQPNITYYQPPGWSSPLVCAIDRAHDTTATTGDTLIAGDSSFVSWAMVNNGTADVTDTLYYYLYIDNSYLAGWYSEGLQVNHYVYVKDYGFVESTPGAHTLSDSGDATHRINESDESDNGYAITYYWKSGDKPNLTSYTPSGWDYPIVPSSESGTHTVGPDLQENATTYIDWAIINNGNATAKPTFYIYLYSDNVPLQGWYCDSLKPNHYAYVEDWTHTFTSGNHTLMTFADSTNTVSESDENDNKYSRAFTWSSGGGGVYTGNAEYIIITDAGFVDAFRPLRDWKTKKGVPASIVTTNYIYNHYSGDDNAEKVRNFIKEAKDSGAIYILLGGQCDYEHGEEYVPRRDAWIFTCGVGYFTDEDTIPCDLYYSDLDGDWDADGDGVYGETGDNVDMYSDIYVGRAPVKNIAQIQNFISKVLTYEKHPDINYVRKIYLPQGNLWSGNSGRGINDTIADTIPDTYQKSKQYEDIQGISRTIVNDSMNSGFNLQHWVGHGSEAGIYYNYGNTVYYHTSDPPNNTNDSTMASIVNSMACLCGAIDCPYVGGSDNDCLAERIVNSNKHSGVATVMNTRYGWGYSSPEGALGPSGELSVWFYRKLFGTSAQHLGEVLSSAKDHLVSTASSDDYFRWCLYEYTLFGDPEMCIWKDRPKSIYADYSDTLGLVDGAPDTFRVYVYDGTKAPVQGALVTVMQDSTIYERDTTDATGWATFILNAQHTGTASVTVTAYDMNYMPHEGYAHTYEPLGIELSFFTMNGDGEIIIIWRAESELGVSSWLIYRSTEKEGNYTNIAKIESEGSSEPRDYTYIDKDVKEGRIYWYKLGKHTSNGMTIWYGPFSGIAGKIPKEFALFQNTPNPFMSTTTIGYAIPLGDAKSKTQKARCQLRIYDASGRVVKTLVDKPQGPGYYRVEWDGRDENGRILPSGTYFYRLECNKFKETKKLILLH